MEYLILGTLVLIITIIVFLFKEVEKLTMKIESQICLWGCSKTVEKGIEEELNK